MYSDEAVKQILVEKEEEFRDYKREVYSVVAIFIFLFIAYIYQRMGLA